MDASKKLLQVMGGAKYYNKILSTFGSSIIAYWPLWESSGSVAADKSGNARNGAYTGVDLGQPGIGDGNTSPYFDGANDYVNVYTASLAAAFSGAEGSMMIWRKITPAALVDGSAHNFFSLTVDAINTVQIYKNASNNGLTFHLQAGSAGAQVVTTASAETTWVHTAITWSRSNDRVIAYNKGVQIGATKTGIGVWAGALAATKCVIGAYVTTPSYVWPGTLAHALILNREATAAEVAIAAKVP